MANNLGGNMIVGLDIGTSKVVAIVGEINAEGGLNIVGIGRHRSRGFVRADDQDPFAEGLQRRHAIEDETPQEHAQEEDAGCGQEGTVRNGKTRQHQVEQRDENGRRADGLQHPDDDFAARAHNRQVIQVVVVEAQEAQDRHDSPLARRRDQIVGRPVYVRDKCRRSENHQQLAGEDGQVSLRNVPIEHTHGRESYSAGLRSYAPA